MPVQFDATNYPNLTVNFIFPSPIGTVDVTEYVQQLRTTRGRLREGDRYTGSASLVLDNWDGRFTPANLSGPYVSGGVSFVRPRVGVQVQATWSAVTYDLFRGYVSSWQDEFPGEGDDSITVVQVADASSILAAWTGLPVAPVGDNELTGARISRILTAAAWPLTSLVDLGNTRCQGTDLAGNGIQQIETVVDTEGGAFFTDGNGRACFEDRGALVTNTRSNTSQVTFGGGGGLPFFAARTSQSEDLLRNIVTYQREGGVAQTASDATSRSLYLDRSFVRTGLVGQSDLEMLAAAEFGLARWKDPEYRIDQLTIKPAADAALAWPHALGRRIRDRATVNAEVRRTGQTITRQVFIEGVTHEISQNSWLTSFAFSSATAYLPFTASRWDTGVWDTMRWFY